MPLPVRNASFQRGSFDGFKTGGAARVEQTFEPFIHARGTLIRPRSGNYFARLDGVGFHGSGINLDSNGFRAKGRPASFREYIIDNAYGRTTGGQGAWLTCADVTIDPGETLFFDWAFAVTVREFPDNRHNGFAALRFIGEDGTDAIPMRVLEQARRLSDEGVFQRDWREEHAPWSKPHPFKGTVQWFVTSGHCVTSAGEQTDADIARAWPACLMIDHIRLG